MTAPANKIVYYAAILVLAYLCWSSLFSSAPRKAAQEQALALRKIAALRAKDLTPLPRDPFAIGVKKDAPPVQAQGPAAAPGGASEKKPAALLPPPLRLAAIIGSGDNWVALVDGKTVKVGDAVGRARVKRISADTVVFQWLSQEVVRRLAAPDLNALAPGKKASPAKRR